jgi:hypothetical protein
MTERPNGLPNDQNEQLIAKLRKKLEDAIKSGENTTPLSVQAEGRISGRILPATTLYQIGEVGSPAYFIDGLSQHGLLNLIDIPALRKGDFQNLYHQDVGTYDRDSNRKMEKIYLDIAGKETTLEQVFFGQDTLNEMVEQGIVHVRPDNQTKQ